MADCNGSESSERTSIVNKSVGGRGASGGVKKYGSTSSLMQRSQEDIVKHVVMPGDTLQGIALRYRVTTEQIRRANRIWANDSLFLRATLDVPVPRTSSDKLCWNDEPDDDDDEDQHHHHHHHHLLPSTSTAGNGNLLDVRRSTTTTNGEGDRQCPSRQDSFNSESGAEHPLIGSRTTGDGGGGASTSSGAGDPGSSEPTFNDIFLRIDSSIAQSRSQADKRERFHELYDGSPLDGASGGRPQHRARMRNSLRQEAEAEVTPRVTVHPVVVTQGRKVQSSLQRIQRQQDEIFEL